MTQAYNILYSTACMPSLDKSSRLYKLRHSCSHALAQAVLQMFPEAKLGIGPPIEHGFYYDFELPRTLIPEDLPLLEEKMRKIIAEKQTFVRRDEPVEKAIEFLKKAGQLYKVDLCEGWKKEGAKTVSFYENVGADGKPRFVDLCEGNHVENLGEIKTLKLLHAAGAYWRGDEKNPMLQRIYGTCFETQEELGKYLFQLEEAKKRDHKKLGRELDLFLISDEVGGGLPLFTPKGFQLRRALENCLTAEKEKNGYTYVWTPHIAKSDLYVKSGHWQKYEAMYPPINFPNTSEVYALKAMNCPHHFEIFLTKKRSYREFPIRLAENGTVYRHEKSGELNGLFRCRALTIDDTHIFVRHDQIFSEYSNVISLIKDVYKKFGFEKYYVRVSVRDKKHEAKYMGSEKLWAQAEEAIVEAAKQNNLPYVMGPGEAAFYGPKLDFMIEDALGREWQCSTAQLDFTQPENFELSYIGQDGKEHRPAVMHIAVVGSIERMLGILIEHYAGAFPFWLAPVQMSILPVSDNYLEYAWALYRILEKEGYRLLVDDSSEKLGKKIRNAELQKIPYMLVVGEKEQKEESVNVRDYATKKQETISVRDLLKKLVRTKNI